MFCPLMALDRIINNDKIKLWHTYFKYQAVLGGEKRMTLKII